MTQRGKDSFSRLLTIVILSSQVDVLRWKHYNATNAAFVFWLFTRRGISVASRRSLRKAWEVVAWFPLAVCFASKGWLGLCYFSFWFRW